MTNVPENPSPFASGRPADAYKYARSRVDFLAITEHNHKGAEKGIGGHDPRRDRIMIAKDHLLYNGHASSSLPSYYETVWVMRVK